MTDTDLIARLERLRSFLDGASDLRGVWFGDRHTESRNAFWWRKDLTLIDVAAAELRRLNARVAELEGDLAHEVEAHGYTKEALRGFIADLDTAEATATALTARVEKLREALVNLDKAASEVARLGAVTGPQWSRLTIASLQSRAAIKETPNA